MNKFNHFIVLLLLCLNTSCRIGTWNNQNYFLVDDQKLKVKTEVSVTIPVANNVSFMQTKFNYIKFGKSLLKLYS